MKSIKLGVLLLVLIIAGSFMSTGSVLADQAADVEPSPAPKYFARIIQAQEMPGNVFEREWSRLGWTDGRAWDRERRVQVVDTPDGVGVPVIISPYYPPAVTPSYVISIDSEITIGDMHYGLGKNANFTIKGPHAIRINAGNGVAQWRLGENGRNLRFMIHCELKLDSDLFVKFVAQRAGEMVGGTSGEGRLTIDISDATHSGAVRYHQYTIGREGARFSHSGGTTLVGNGLDTERGNRFIAGVAQAFGGEGSDLVLQSALLDPGGFEHRVRGLEIDGVSYEPGSSVDNTHDAIVGEGRIVVVGAQE